MATNCRLHYFNETLFVANDRLRDATDANGQTGAVVFTGQEDGDDPATQRHCMGR